MDSGLRRNGSITFIFEPIVKKDSQNHDLISNYGSIYDTTMIQRAKLLSRMRANPRDWSIDDLKALAKHFDVDWRQPGTSHVTFTAAGQIPVTVPAHKPVKPIYIKKFLALLDAIGVSDDKNER
jgi:hypothetical protein